MNDASEGSLDLEEVSRLVDLAIREDAGSGDITSETLFDPGHLSRGVVLVHEEGVIAGLPVFRAVYRRISGAVRCAFRVREGEAVGAGQEVVDLQGPTIMLLMGERTALNFLQRLSGIATLTRRLAGRAAGKGITLLDTRKTTPGLRSLEKYAVRIGGGRNHRMDLSEMCLVKENHIAAAGGISAALEKMMRGGTGGKAVEVEVKDLRELEEALKFPIDRIMLDNFSPEEISKAVERIRLAFGKGRGPKIEVSGGIGEGNIEAYFLDGVDYISVGALTHSARALDISMNLQPERT